MSTQWVNTQPDAGALHALLLSLVPRVPVIDIDELWIFPTRKIAIGESTVIVLSLYDADAERRRVMTARFTVSRDKKGVAKVVDKLDEYGSAPLDAVSRVVEGVVRRLGEEIEQPPRNERIEGNVETLNTLLLDLGAPKAALLSDVGDADGNGDGDRDRDPADADRTADADPAGGPPAGAGDADDDQDASLPEQGDQDREESSDDSSDDSEPETEDESLPDGAEQEAAR